MRTRIEFPSGMSGLDGVHACVFERFDENALCVTLESEAAPEACLLLGDVSRLIPGCCAELAEGEIRQLGGWQENGCGVYCRMRIPCGDPTAAGFDTDRLVLVNFRTGLGLEKDRPWLGVVPFAAHKARQSG